MAARFLKNNVFACKYRENECAKSMAWIIRCSALRRLVCAAKRPCSWRQICHHCTQKCQKNAAGKHSSVMRNGAFGTTEEPFPHGDKASSVLWGVYAVDSIRRYGMSDVAVPFYFVNVNCQNKIKLLSRCSKLIAIILCAVQNLHFKVRRVSVVGYTTDKTLKWKPEGRT